MSWPVDRSAKMEKERREHSRKQMETQAAMEADRRAYLGMSEPFREQKSPEPAKPAPAKSAPKREPSFFERLGGAASTAAGRFPSFKRGGTMRKAGVARLHAGEKVAKRGKGRGGCR